MKVFPDRPSRGAAVPHLVVDTITILQQEPCCINSADCNGIVPHQTTGGLLVGDNQRRRFTPLLLLPIAWVLGTIALSWWNLDDKSLHRESIDRKTVTVAAPEAARDRSIETSGKQERQQVWIIALIAITGLIAVTVVVAHRRGDAIRDPEQSLFKDFEAACRLNDRQQIMMTLTAWLDYSLPQSRPILIGEWAARTGDAKLVTLIDQLEEALYGRTAASSEATFPGHKLARCVHRLRHHSRPHRNDRSAPLAPLNSC
jgi:hypothetical protein